MIMTKLNTKEIVLIAFYTEYQKDIPNIGEINASDLGLEKNVFIVAVQQLQNEGLIKGAKFTKDRRVLMDYILLTTHGLEYVEEKLAIKPTMNAGEKVKEVTLKTAKMGYNELKDFVAKVTAEIIKSSIQG